MLDDVPLCRIIERRILNSRKMSIIQEQVEDITSITCLKIIKIKTNFLFYDYFINMNKKKKTLHLFEGGRRAGSFGNKS
jgi:hypothetical protein